ncbi:branched-chain amino acid ABC transporter permease [Paracoccus aurantiacus]|uniref:Branched-chain amino acid ABC transporter permease n=1 Tax=Paracoccus aurantiacus TaxID=2599412 RepID=A0A5C6S6G4_9RHOB|nr:branched-chain amino acid ABC transporter permease [Paracoccus aurantiacus]TXB69631.1 branched-chain amino acid ABC transporter permease [Paracoccus aurantiacus]
MFRLDAMRIVLLVLLLAGMQVFAMLGGFFGQEIVAEIAILAILAISLDLAAGFGGMVSLGHGAIMGVGAYAYALAGQHGLTPWPAALTAIAASGVTGGLIGAVSARMQGIFFIMATLAFGQMIWAFTFSARWLGGDNGMGGIARASLPFSDLSQPMAFANYALCLLLAVFLLAAATLSTPFGRSYQAVHDNAARAAAIGLAPRRIRITGFAISSAIAGVAGILAAQHMQFISPAMMFWTTSGEVLVVLILGGIGTLTGPIVGAAIFVTLKYWAAGWTDHWHLVIGALLIAVILAGGRGITGEAERRLRHAFR